MRRNCQKLTFVIYFRELHKTVKIALSLNNLEVFFIESTFSKCLAVYQTKVSSL